MHQIGKDGHFEHFYFCKYSKRWHIQSSYRGKSFRNKSPWTKLNDFGEITLRKSVCILFKKEMRRPNMASPVYYGPNSQTVRHCVQPTVFSQTILLYFSNCSFKHVVCIMYNVHHNTHPMMNFHSSSQSGIRYFVQCNQCQSNVKIVLHVHLYDFIL